MREVLKQVVGFTPVLVVAFLILHFDNTKLLQKLVEAERRNAELHALSREDRATLRAALDDNRELIASNRRRIERLEGRAEPPEGGPAPPGAPKQSP